MKWNTLVFNYQALIQPFYCKVSPVKPQVSFAFQKFIEKRIQLTVTHSKKLSILQCFAPVAYQKFNKTMKLFCSELYLKHVVGIVHLIRIIPIITTHGENEKYMLYLANIMGHSSVPTLLLR